VELEQEAQQRAFALLGGDDIIAETLAPGLDLEEIKPPVAVGFQKVKHLFRGKMMPVFSDQLLHDYGSFLREDG